MIKSVNSHINSDDKGDILTERLFFEMEEREELSWVAELGALDVDDFCLGYNKH